MTSRLRADGGFTLIELLVTMVLFGVVGSIVSSSIVTGLKDQTRMSAHAAEMAKLRTAMQRVTREIRSTYQVMSATGTQLVLCQSNPRVVIISAQPSGAYTTLQMTAASQSCDSPFSAQTVQTLDTRLVNDGSHPVFTAQMCTTGPYCVGQVTVHLEDSVPGTSEVIQLTNNVTVRNQP
jgi:prepilin-type N-terminal cleavage/methylation domain-containing protein